MLPRPSKATRSVSFNEDVATDSSIDSQHSSFPCIQSESTDFLIPENQLSIEYIHRQHQINIQEVSFKPYPTYLNSLFDEFARNYVVVHVGKTLQETVQLAKYDPSSCQNILQNYNPGFRNCYSTFKRSPFDQRYLLNGRVHSDFNLLIRVNNFVLLKQKPFEPLFATFCIYTIIDDKLVRICESFNFDCTHESIRKQYTELYKHSKERSVNVGDGNSTDGYINKFKVTIPEDLRSKDLFVIVQLNKILTSPADVAFAPYKSSPSVPPEISKHKALCNRLLQFRQPIGIAIERIRDDHGKLDRDFHINMKFFSQKACVSDEGIQQVSLIC